MSQYCLLLGKGRDARPVKGRDARPVKGRDARPVGPRCEARKGPRCEARKGPRCEARKGPRCEARRAESGVGLDQLKGLVSAVSSPSGVRSLEPRPPNGFTTF